VFYSLWSRGAARKTIINAAVNGLTRRLPKGSSGYEDLLEIQQA